MNNLAGSRDQYVAFLLCRIEEFKDSLSRDQLLALADEAVRNIEAQSNSAQVLTEPIVLEELDRLIIDHLQLPSYREWATKVAEAGASVGRADATIIQTAGLVDPAGRQIVPGTSAFATIAPRVREISDELIHMLANKPELMHELSPQKFEELVAELLVREGYDVRLTQLSRDGGRDLLATLHTGLGRFLYLVECKRYRPDRPVGVRPVRELYGVLLEERATAAALVTTSRFTDDAKQFCRGISYQLALRDFNQLAAWLRSLSE